MECLSREVDQVIRKSDDQMMECLGCEFGRTILFKGSFSCLPKGIPEATKLSDRLIF